MTDYSRVLSGSRQGGSITRRLTSKQDASRQNKTPHIRRLTSKLTSSHITNEQHTASAIRKERGGTSTKRPGACLAHFTLNAICLDEAVLTGVAAVTLAATPAAVVVLTRPCSLALAAVVAPPLVLAHVR